MSGLFKRYFLLLPFIVLFVSGCMTTGTPYDYSAFERNKPRSIVIIPPNNNSVEVNAPYIYLSTLSRPLAEKGYYVFPVSVIDHFLKENGLPTPAEMNSIPLERIGEHIGADAVLYISIEDWGQKFQVITSVTRVEAKLRLVDVRSAELLWQATAVASQSSDAGNNGLLGAVINAVVNQIAATTIVDNTPRLARHANNIAINSEGRGLPKGPYAQPTAKTN